MHIVSELCGDMWLLATLVDTDVIMSFNDVTAKKQTHCELYSCIEQVCTGEQLSNMWVSACVYKASFRMSLHTDTGVLLNRW